MIEHLGLLIFLLAITLLLAGLVLRARNAKTEEQNGSFEIRAGAQRAHLASAALTMWVRVTVTMLLLAAALWVILSQRYPADEQKWAFGVIGTILGYWLKG